MKTLLIFIACVLGLSCLAAPTPPPTIYRNFWTTNANAREIVAAGSNVFVGFTTTGTDIRTYTIDVPASGSGIGVAASSSVGISTNGTVVTPFVQGTLTNSISGSVLDSVTGLPILSGNGHGAILYDDLGVQELQANEGLVTVTAIQGDGSALTHLTPGNISSGIANISVAASNIFSGGTLPMGTVATNALPLAFYRVTADGAARATTFNGSSLTNLNASQLTTGTVPVGVLPGSVLTNSDTRAWTNISTTGITSSNASNPQFIAEGYGVGASGAGKGQIQIGSNSGNAGYVEYHDGGNSFFNIRNSYSGAGSAMLFQFGPASITTASAAMSLVLGTGLTVANNAKVSGTLTATNGVVNLIKQTFTTNFTCLTNLQFYCCNGTNQIITLPDARNVQGVIFRFSSTNGYGSFTLTNATGTQTIRDGTSLTLTSIGIQPVDLISDGANWWLSSKTKVILPNAQFSCTTNIPMTSANVAYPVTFNSTDFDRSQGIVLAAGTNGLFSKMWITNSGQYEFDPSIVINFSGADTVTIWFRQNDTNVVNSATAVKGAAGGSIRCITIPFIVNVTQPTAYEIWMLATGTGNLLQTQAAGGVAPNDFPLSPSIICPVKRISDGWP